MIVVSNTTPLIGLAAIQRFILLRQLFSDLYIAEAVYDESIERLRQQGFSLSQTVVDAVLQRAGE